MSAITEVRWATVVILATTLIALAATGSGAAAAESAAEQRGAELMSAVESGDTDCGELTSSDYTAIGEFAMGRMLGPSKAHEAMDRMAASMMGGGGLERMHRVMGVRFSGCGNPGLPSNLNGMMGALGMMGGGFGPGGGRTGGGGFGPGAGENGQGPWSHGFGSSAMMGFDRGGSEDNNGFGAWMAVAMLLLLIGGGAAFVVVIRSSRRQRSGSSAPLDLLAQRFARGELGPEEYAERRRLLAGDSR